MMTLSVLECFFLLGFVAVFIILGIMEIQIHQIKVMMEEHVRFDEPLSMGHCPPNKNKKQKPLDK